MNDEQTIKAVGGVAPFGYVWQNGSLVVDEQETPVRRLIYELFIKHRRKKTVARLLNDLGYRTRNGSLFSDTTVDRLLRDTTAKGTRIENGREIQVEAIVSMEVWQTANSFLGEKQTKQPIHLFVGFAFCICGGKMIVPGNAEKYVCVNCRHKIPTDTLEEIFTTQIKRVTIESENISNLNLADYWQDFSAKEKRLIVEQTLHKIIVGKTDISIEFAYLPNSLKTPQLWQQNEQGNETSKIATSKPDEPAVNEPLMNEVEAAKFLGISRMTLLRRRNANEIGFFRVGFRILYSKEKHLIPFIKKCER